MEGEKSKKETTKKKHKHYSQPFDFEGMITKSLETAGVPIGKLFIDKVNNKPFLRKITIRTSEGKHFRMVIGKQELVQGHQMFCAILKAKYLQALKLPDKVVKTDGRKKTYKPKPHGRAKGNSKRKPKDTRGMGSAIQRPNGNSKKAQPTLE